MPLKSICAVVKKDIPTEDVYEPEKLISLKLYSTFDEAWKDIWKILSWKLIDSYIIPETTLFLFEEYLKSIFVESGIAIFDKVIDSDAKSQEHYCVKEIKNNGSLILEDFVGVRICDALNPNSDFCKNRSSKDPQCAMNEGQIAVLQCVKAAREDFKKKRAILQSIMERKTTLSSVEGEEQKEKLREEIKDLLRQSKECFDEDMLIRREIMAIPQDLKLKLESLGASFYSEKERNSLIFNALVIKHLDELGFDITIVDEMRNVIIVRDMNSRAERIKFVKVNGIGYNDERCKDFGRHAFRITSRKEGVILRKKAGY